MHSKLFRDHPDTWHLFRSSFTSHGLDTQKSRRKAKENKGLLLRKETDIFFFFFFFSHPGFVSKKIWFAIVVNIFFLSHLESVIQYTA
jgi:hypothetical protein